MKIDFDKDYMLALFTEWCVINGEPDIFMFSYLRGYEFCLDRMKKAK
jgi:hypothetical protein